MAVPVLTIAQMRAWEVATWASGQTEAEVIRRVGKAVAEVCRRLTQPDDLAVLLTGKGHNGDDVRAAREHLAGRRVSLLEVNDPKSDLSRLEAALSLRPALIIDGLFGIGLNRPLAPEWIEVIEMVNGSGRPVLSVDVPSGLNADTGEPQGAAIRAAITCTVGAPKIGLLQAPAWPFVGRLEVLREIGLAAEPDKSELNWTLPEDFLDYPPRREAASHKGTYGHLAIFAGTLGYHGAAVLAARGAQRAQPGLVTLYTHETAYPAAAAQLQAVMVSPWKTEPRLPESCTAIVIGPGLAAAELTEGIREGTGKWWRESRLPVIVDASALEWLPEGPVPENVIRLITPHPGEAARLLGSTSHAVQADRLKALRELSRRLGNSWIVLKGHQTLIGRTSGEVFVNSSGNPYLAQGGSGDTLSGYLGGLLAQPALQVDARRTIRFAVWEHGAAADRLQARRQGWVVEELAEELGKVRAGLA